MSGGAHELLELGKRYCAQKQYARAEVAYREVLVGEPTNVEALRLLGELAVTARRADIGVGLLARAAELEPGNAEIGVILGNARLAGGDVEGAVADFRRVIGLHGDSVAGLNCLALALIRVGRLREAVPELQKVVELRPEVGEGHALFANTLAGVGRFEEAVGEYRRAIELGPDLRRHAEVDPVDGVDASGRTSEEWFAAMRAAVDQEEGQ